MDIGKIGKLLNAARWGRYASYIWQHAFKAARRNNVSAWSIVKEQIRLYLETGLNYRDHYYFGLYDASMTYEERKAFIGDSQMLTMWPRLCSPKYGYVLGNKLIARQLFHSWGFPVPRLLGVYDPDWGHTVDGYPLKTAQDLEAWLRRDSVCEPVFKPLEGGGGGCMVLVFVGKRLGPPVVLLHISGKVYTPEDVIRELSDEAELEKNYEYNPETLRGFVVEERIRQHRLLRDLCGETLCTVRAMTVNPRDQEPELVRAVWKMQVRPVGIDTMKSGALPVAIDAETGRLGHGWAMGSPPEQQCRRHPETGREFYGFQLPYWTELRELVVNAAQAFPFVHVISWDVAVSESGPVLVEANPSFSVYPLQNCFRKGLMTGTFKRVCERVMAQPPKRYRPWP